MQTPDRIETNFWVLDEKMPDAWFENLDAQRYKALLESSEIKIYADGEVILHEDTAQQPWLFFLLSGQVALLKAGKLLDVLKRRGDAFGATGMIGDPGQAATVQAVGETRCFMVDAFQIQRIAGDDKLVFGCILYRLFAETVGMSLRTTNQSLSEAYQELDQLKTKKP